MSDPVTVAIGKELRRIRDGREWSRPAVADRVPGKFTPQALAHYENGIRACSVARFVEVCVALNVPACDVLALALQRAAIQTGAKG
ncbi:MAG TPA: helix-turn-helix transcriptional regulator [Pedococcus sp.]|nr:helix-turn-helix transcriptional regulator [Pedococcus sp.]